jgi:hypothetical protein
MVSILIARRLVPALAAEPVDGHRVIAPRPIEVDGDAERLAVVAEPVDAHPEAVGGLAGVEEPLGTGGKLGEQSGKAGVGEALHRRHPAMLDGAALEQRRNILRRKRLD